jgi:hypothetical protein
MAYAASAFQGTAFKIGSPLVAVPGILELPAIPQTHKEIDVTAIDDTTSQFIADPLTDFGSFDLLLAYDKDNTQHMALASAFTAKTSVAGQLTMGDGEILTGNFLPLSWSMAGGKGQSSQRRITMRPTGALVTT